MAMENNPFEDVFPIEHGDFSIAMLLYGRVHHKLFLWIPHSFHWIHWIGAHPEN